MASRAELVQMCKELEIKDKGLNIDEMTSLVREAVDKKFDIKYRRVGNSEMSRALLRFISTEYDYVFKNKQGKQVNIDGEEL